MNQFGFYAKEPGDEVYFFNILRFIESNIGYIGKAVCRNAKPIDIITTNTQRLKRYPEEPVSLWYVGKDCCYERDGVKELYRNTLFVDLQALNNAFMWAAEYSDDGTVPLRFAWMHVLKPIRSSYVYSSLLPEGLLPPSALEDVLGGYAQQEEEYLRLHHERTVQPESEFQLLMDAHIVAHAGLRMIMTAYESGLNWSLRTLIQILSVNRQEWNREMWKSLQPSLPNYELLLK